MPLFRNLSIKRITVAIFLAATINLGWQFYRMYRESIESEKAYEQYGVIACKFGLARDESSRMYIELFLLIACLGSIMRGLKHTLLSVIGLSGAGLFYLFWWRYYFDLAGIAPGEALYSHHTWYLYRASYLHIALVGGIVLLVVIHIQSALCSLFRTTRAWRGLADE